MGKPLQIKMPKIDQDASMGDVLGLVISIMNEISDCDNDVIVDVGGIEYLHPFLISYLSFYKKSSGIKIDFANKSESLNTRFERICFENPVLFSDHNTEIKHLLEGYWSQKELPICIFNCNYSRIDQFETEIKKVLMYHLGDIPNKSNFKNAVNYIISEMVDNIQEHSNASHGFLYLDHSDGKDLYICIGDNGITILGSYLTQSLSEFERFKKDSVIEALHSSVNGLSTKNVTERGYGLSTNLDMVSNGMKGEFVIISGNGVYYRINRREFLLNLPNELRWDGTFILIKVPIRIDDDFDYIKYIE